MYLYILLFQQPFPKLLSNLLSCQHIRLLIFFIACLFLLFILFFLSKIPCISQYKIKWSSVLIIGSGFLLAGYYRFYDFFFYYLIGNRIFFFQHGLFRNSDRCFNQISDHRIHISSHIAHFSKFSRFHFDKWCIHEFRKPSGYLCFTASCRPHHQNILRGYFLPHLF